MRHTEDIILRLLKIRKARKLSESPIMSEENVQKLRDFIIENRRQIPSFALSHFDRLEASGKLGLAEIVDGKCAACGAAVPQDEIDYLGRNHNIGVCDNCYAFIFMPNEKFDVEDFFKKFLA